MKLIVCDNELHRNDDHIRMRQQPANESSGKDSHFFTPDNSARAKLN